MYDMSEVEPVVYVLLPPFKYDATHLDFFLSNVLSLKFSGEVVMLYQGNSKRHHMLILRSNDTFAFKSVKLPSEEASTIEGFRVYEI